MQIEAGEVLRLFILISEYFWAKTCQITRYRKSGLFYGKNAVTQRIAGEYIDTWMNPLIFFDLCSRIFLSASDFPLSGRS